MATLLLETLSSLKSTPASTQTEEKVKEFLSKTEDLGLTKAEKLMLLNHRPQSELEVHLIVEESEERLQEEQVRLGKGGRLPRQKSRWFVAPDRCRSCCRLSRTSWGVTKMTTTRRRRAETKTTARRT